jgi:hypothetical protein
LSRLPAEQIFIFPNEKLQKRAAPENYSILFYTVEKNHIAWVGSWLHLTLHPVPARKKGFPNKGKTLVPIEHGLKALAIIVS